MTGVASVGVCRHAPCGVGLVADSGPDGGSPFPGGGCKCRVTVIVGLACGFWAAGCSVVSGNDSESAIMTPSWPEVDRGERAPGIDGGRNHPTPPAATPPAANACPV